MCNTTTDRNHADPALEKYVTETVMAIVKGFFSSPFSVNHANLQVFLFILASDLQVMCVRIEESSKCHGSVLILEENMDSPVTPAVYQCRSWISTYRNVALKSVSIIILSNAIKAQVNSVLSAPQTNQSIFIKLLQSSFRIYNCAWLSAPQKANIESCIKTLADVGEWTVQPFGLNDT